MAKAKSKANRKADDDPDVVELLGEVARGTGELLGQQVELLRAELREELGRAGGAVGSLGAGVALVAAGGALASLAAVHGLHRATRLPLWGCYGLVGGLLGGAGLVLLGEGRRAAGGVGLVPESRAALRENLAWVRDRAT